MKIDSYSKIVGLSLVTAMLLGSSAYAGKIVTDAVVSDPVVTEDTQFGFGGWNLENIDVRIVDVSDFAGNVGTFFSDGTYSSMGSDMSFESDITTDGELRGHLHGKDWPVGEPSGIKVINDDLVGHGKPNNCIMTSSYLAYQDMEDDTSGSGYLDTTDPDGPNPVLCSSPFQTHKRFKINLLETSVDNIADGAEGYGEPVDLIFNLVDGDTTEQRYQVLQKANNYTGKRLKGYKVEVLDANGDKNPALTLSLGEGEDDNADIWEVEDMANMSHGLWGPIDDHFEAPGFFDYVRAFYPVALSADNQTISYNGDMAGGNYQAIFGNWLPSIWEPEGVFHDDDEDPETDGVLKAFYGTAPGFTEDAWYKSIVDITDPKIPVYTWALATEQDLADWSGDWYSTGSIEDVLNLGLNYIINVGSNADIGKTFILRITPYVDSDQSAPSYYVPPVDPTPPANGGPKANAGEDKAAYLYTPMTISGSGTDSDGTIVSYEWKDGTTVLAKTATFDFIPALPGLYTLTLTVTDNDGLTGTDSMSAFIADNSGSGGGCTYNPNSKNFDMTFLMMMALGLLYPFRRRFLK